GRRGPARDRARAPAVRRQAAPDPQAGRPPHPRPADEGAQEVRPAGRALQVPVLEAVVVREAAMLKVAVTGASGYMGAELLRLLSVHPKVRISAVTSDRLAGERLDRLYPHLRGLSDLQFQWIAGDRLADEADVVFLALQIGRASCRERV